MGSFYFYFDYFSFCDQRHIWKYLKIPDVGLKLCVLWSNFWSLKLLKIDFSHANQFHIKTAFFSLIFFCTAIDVCQQTTTFHFLYHNLSDMKQPHQMSIFHCSSDRFECKIFFLTLNVFFLFFLFCLVELWFLWLQLFRMNFKCYNADIIEKILLKYDLDNFKYVTNGNMIFFIFYEWFVSWKMIFFRLFFQIVKRLLWSTFDNIAKRIKCNDMCTHTRRRIRQAM